MKVEKIAKDVVALFQSQKQQLGDVHLRSIKVALPQGCNADEVAAYIVANYPYEAHSRENTEGTPILAIGHR